MKRWSVLSWPIRRQIAVLLFVTQLFAQFMTVLAINWIASRSGSGMSDLVVSSADPFLTVLRMTDGATDEQVMAVVSGLPNRDDRFRFQAAPPPDEQQVSSTVQGLRADLFDRVPEGWRPKVVMFSADGPIILAPIPLAALGLSAEMPDGRWLTYQPGGDALVQSVPRATALLGILILALPLSFLSAWAAVALVSPIAAMARAAERFSADTAAGDLPEEGPAEVRRATRAMNRMHQRIRKLVADRSQTLASIGHDMRTPLTRLRLRTELLDSGPAREAIEGDLSTLDQMIDDALAFLRAESRPLRIEAVDVAALCRTIVDDYTDRGSSVRYRGPGRLVLACDAELLRRALDNIVGNAAKFATNAEVQLSAITGAVRFDVSDDGPGIPAAHRGTVLEPFSRLDAVREGVAQGAQGFGLGLAIARDLIERQGGSLTLLDNKPKGLTARIELPLRPEENAHV